MAKKGFSLIELMMVVTILSALVAVSIPQYYRFLAKSKRTEGILYLQGIHQSQISYFADLSKFVVTTDPRLFQSAGTLKYYGNLFVVPEVLGKPLGSNYIAFLYGDIDTDAWFDELCIAYPINITCDCDKPTGIIGKVVVNIDDIFDKGCWQ